MSKFKSNNVMIYPAANRKINNDYFASMNSEHHIIEIRNTLVDHKSYLQKEDLTIGSDHKLKAGTYILNGYNVVIKEDITLTPPSNLSEQYVYLGISLTSSVQNLPNSTNNILVYRIDGLDDMSENYTGVKIYFSTSELADSDDLKYLMLGKISGANNAVDILEPIQKIDTSSTNFQISSDSGLSRKGLDIHNQKISYSNFNSWLKEDFILDDGKLE